MFLRKGWSDSGNKITALYLLIVNPSRRRVIKVMDMKTAQFLTAPHGALSKRHCVSLADLILRNKENNLTQNLLITASQDADFKLLLKPYSAQKLLTLKPMKISDHLSVNVHSVSVTQTGDTLYTQRCFSW